MRTYAGHSSAAASNALFRRNLAKGQTGQAALDVHQNLHHGKVAVLCLAPREGLGVRDHQLRDRHLSQINRFRNE